MYDLCNWRLSFSHFACDDSVHPSDIFVFQIYSFMHLLFTHSCTHVWNITHVVRGILHSSCILQFTHLAIFQWFVHFRRPWTTVRKLIASLGAPLARHAASSWQTIRFTVKRSCQLYIIFSCAWGEIKLLMSDVLAWETTFTHLLEGLKHICVTLFPRTGWRFSLRRMLWSLSVEPLWPCRPHPVASVQGIVPGVNMCSFKKAARSARSRRRISLSLSLSRVLVPFIFLFLCLLLLSRVLNNTPHLVIRLWS